MGNVEQFKHKLLSMLLKSFTDNGNLQWIDLLLETTYNSAIKSAPNEYDSKIPTTTEIKPTSKPKLKKETKYE